jgi:hypothetical protein
MNRTAFSCRRRWLGRVVAIGKLGWLVEWCSCYSRRRCHRIVPRVHRRPWRSEVPTTAPSGYTRWSSRPRRCVQRRSVGGCVQATVGRFRRSRLTVDSATRLVCKVAATCTRSSWSGRRVLFESGCGLPSRVLPSVDPAVWSYSWCGTALIVSRVSVASAAGVRFGQIRNQCRASGVDHWLNDCTCAHVGRRP